MAIMEDLINELERRVRRLIAQQKDLQQSNDQLSQGKFNLVREKKMIFEKQQGAVKQIESLISRLKSIEQSS